MDICDTYLKEQRIKQEAEREAEILNFLDQMADGDEYLTVDFYISYNK